MKRLLHTKPERKGEVPAKPGKLWNRAKTRMKTFAARALLAAGLILGASMPKAAKADDAWLVAYPAYSYNIENDSHNPNIRIAGGGEIAYEITGSAVFNTFSPERNSADLQFGHSELRLHRRFLDWFGPALQYELEPGEDNLRAGMVLIPPIGDSAFLLLRVLPFTVPTQHHSSASDFLCDPKLTLYLSTSMDSFLFEMELDWNLRGKALWLESAVDYMFASQLGLGVQVRHNFAFEAQDSTEVLLRGVLKL
ncbi:MAG: hypothetical protein AB1657_05310 [Candidatus Micrarchaeota archaeon]